MRTAPFAFSRNDLVLAIFFLIMLGFVGFTLWAHTQLPDRVPVHFDGSGAPDRISSKMELTVVNLGVAGLMVLLFGVLPFFLSKIPTSLINLPHKDYWLAPERAEESLADMKFHYIAMGITTMLLLWFIMWGVYEVGSKSCDTLPYSWWALGIYFVVLTWQCVVLYRRFPKPTAE